MTSSRRLAFAVIVSVVGYACATAVPETGGGSATGPGSGDGGAVDGSPSYGGGDTDSGTPTRPRPDSGPPPIDDDSGPPPPPVDSGPPAGSGIDCTGTESDQIGETYARVCDGWYESGGPAEDCTIGGGQCGVDPSGSGYTMCCYKPSSSSYCYEDYGGKPQCVPQ
jgi:hypothetical protein